MSERLVVEHVLQPALLVRSMDRALDFFVELLGIYPSERVDIAPAGVNNAVYAFERMTFLELIEPYNESAAAFRLLQRTGEGWHMVSCDLEPIPRDDADGLLDKARVRVVQRNRTDHVRGAWHLHPRDLGGVLLNLVTRNDWNENGAYAGFAWREYVQTNTRVIRSILGVSIVTGELENARDLYTVLGFRFGDAWKDDGDLVLQADCPRGTFLQLRSPTAPSAPSAAELERRGPGLFHLVLEACDLDAARQRVDSTSARIAREPSADAFWTDPATTFNVPFEFRRGL